MEAERREVKLRFRKNEKEEILWQMVKKHTDKAAFVKECLQHYYDSVESQKSIHHRPIDVSGII